MLIHTITKSITSSMTSSIIITDGEKPFSSCLTFNGVDEQSKLLIPDNTALNISSALTVSAWAKNNNAIINTFSKEAIVGKFDFSIDNYCEWKLAINDNEKVEIFLSQNGVSTSSYWESTNAVNINKWNHYAFVFNGGTSLNVYLNGVEIPGSFVTGSLPASIFNGPTNLTIGSVREPNTEVWEGQICDVRIFNSNLSAAQISSIYLGASIIPNLAAWYPLNEGGGTTANDVSVNSNNGTLSAFNLVNAWAVNQNIFRYNG